MSEPEILTTLRSLLTDELKVNKIAERAGIQPLRLWRFKKKGKPLSLEDAEKLSLTLTGKPLVIAPDVL